MKLTVLDIQEEIAIESKKDDAFEIWLQLSASEKSKAAPAAWYSRHGIKENEEFYTINFVDEDGGEITFLNCSKILHKAMIRFNLYPDFIMNAFKRKGLCNQ